MDDNHIVALIAAILLGSQVTREENPNTRQTFGFDADPREVKTAVRTARIVLQEAQSGEV